MKRKSGFVVDTERAIQLSLIDSFEACDLCGLVLKACDLINKSLAGGRAECAAVNVTLRQLFSAMRLDASFIN